MLIIPYNTKGVPKRIRTAAKAATELCANRYTMGTIYTNHYAMYTGLLSKNGMRPPQVTLFGYEERRMYLNVCENIK